MKFLILALAITLTACSDKESGEQVVNEPKKQCVLPWGGLANHGETKVAFKEKEAVKCESEMRTCNDGTLVGSFENADCKEKPVNQDDPSKEKPIFIDASGKKWGSIKEMSKVSLWKLDGWHGDRPECAPDVSLGKACDPIQTQACKKPDGTKLICQTDMAYKVWGWIYEKDGVNFKPLEGVKIDQFWFAGCLVGICVPAAGPVFTDKDGYFEYMTSNLLDTIRILGKDGYFGLCNRDNKPIAGGGTSQLGIGKPTLGGVQYKLTPDSCKNGLPE